MDYDACRDDLIDHISAKLDMSIHDVSRMYEYLFEHGFLGDEHDEARNLLEWHDVH